MTTKEPKPIKRFNNGHKTFNYQEQEFLKEIYDAERNSYDKFTEKAPSMRRPRDPIMGEETPRTFPGSVPTTELWMPASHFPPPFIPTFTGRERNRTTEPPTDIALTSTLQRRRMKIDSEIKVVQKQLAYKKALMNGST
jgi:hypothetical protein